MVDFIGRGTSTECDLLGHGKEIVAATIEHQTPAFSIRIGAVDLTASFQTDWMSSVGFQILQGRFVACFDQTEGMYSKPSQMGTTSESSGQT
jgi:hypothetical protein